MREEVFLTLSQEYGEGYTSVWGTGTTAGICSFTVKFMLQISHVR